MTSVLLFLCSTSQVNFVFNSIKKLHRKSWKKNCWEGKKRWRNFHGEKERKKKVKVKEKSLIDFSQFPSLSLSFVKLTSSSSVCILVSRWICWRLNFSLPKCEKTMKVQWRWKLFFLVWRKSYKVAWILILKSYNEEKRKKRKTIEACEKGKYYSSCVDLRKCCSCNSQVSMASHTRPFLSFTESNSSAGTDKNGMRKKLQFFFAFFSCRFPSAFRSRKFSMCWSILY